MKKALLAFRTGFHIMTGNGRAQAAEMVIPAGESVGSAGNRHAGADQWLFIVSGSGVATVDGREHRLRPRCLILIEQGETHAVHNTGKTMLRTLNFYTPPVYASAEYDPPAGLP